MSNFTFGLNVFKSRLLLFRQNASAGGKGLIRNEIRYYKVILFIKMIPGNGLKILLFELQEFQVAMLYLSVLSSLWMLMRSV